MYGVILDERDLAQQRASAQAYLNRIAAHVGAESLRVRTAVVVNQAVDAILNYANTHAVDLIALETHGRSGVRRWLLGNVADKVVRGATLPVLLHRPQHEQQTP